MAIKSEIITAVGHVTDHAKGTVTRGGKVVGFSESLREGRAASGDFQHSGTLDYGFVGPTPKGEQGTLETCRTLVRVMNTDEPIWREPEALSTLPHIDCRVARLDGHEPALDIQVVRAFVDPAFWQHVRQTGQGAGVSVTSKELAQGLLAAIELKANKIPLQARSSLLLALSALDSPVMAFDAVVDEFRNQFSLWAAAQGFLAIWLVGPNSMLTHRLV
ncbi:MAG TPA: hypothetical protein VIE67_08065 [Rudaea sp.]|jgi:hypothetical protein|uniref:hypothetical protein n=1 Tax=Rudaea sp. TaxID=2136325 RepID=UPI002F940CF3